MKKPEAQDVAPEGAAAKAPEKTLARPSRKLAVALHYDNRSAPRVTAKGMGPVAERIVEIAREAGVPVEANSPLAEALSHLELDEEIPEALYQAVAVLIGFILRKGKAPNPPG
ncbi:EscU/YscU/HrcU family type III secretion system export apparatus switch protein [Pannonibacter indicus]|uniref:Type III secretion system substrate exporter, FlhB-like n=1 Tax=Pannonibacter indicus TaxID=466044 RepID=A0A0K6I9D5_9HYPH|nr:EscU/YscU/HrcU family type III secretion system export apparatus switch protein [Pannonibacter indicus]CUA99731.1 Type III secretion system substrate exporter, FlhB-like [Pannonibacter indicus]